MLYKSEFHQDILYNVLFTAKWWYASVSVLKACTVKSWSTVILDQYPRVTLNQYSITIWLTTWLAPDWTLNWNLSKRSINQLSINQDVHFWGYWSTLDQRCLLGFSTPDPFHHSASTWLSSCINTHSTKAIGNIHVVFLKLISDYR